MVSASQTTRTPSLVMKTLLAPAARRDGFRAFQAPLGLRRIESALAARGLSTGGRGDRGSGLAQARDRAGHSHHRRLLRRSARPRHEQHDDVGHPRRGDLHAAAGSGASSKASAAFADPPRPKRRSCSAAPARGRLAGNRRAQEELGIDHVVSGYCEGNIGALFARILDGEELPGALAGERVAAAEKIPPILGPTLMGGLEISRGCGLGCAFCTLARVPMEHLPMDAILADAAGEPRRRRDGPRSRHRGRFPLRSAGSARAAGGADRTRHAPPLSRPRRG